MEKDKQQFTTDKQCILCGATYTPSRSDQQYCCRTHQMFAFNNASRIKNKAISAHNKSLKENKRILKKIYSSWIWKPNVPTWLFEYEKFNFKVYSSAITSETGNVEGFVILGMEVRQVDEKHYTITIRESNGGN